MVMIFRSAVLIFDKRGVQRGRFTRTGRPGHENNSMRQVEHAIPHVPIALRHAQMFQPEEGIAAIENAQHDCFAVNHRNDADAQVDLASGDFQPDTAVLRDALLGDVQMTQDLEARDNRRLEFADLRRNVGFDQHAVNSITHAQLILERLDVNVGGAGFERLGHDLIHELDDRCILRRVGEIQIVFVAVFQNRDVIVVGHAHGLERVGADAEVFLDELIDFR